ncbi:MAG: hypothetical protein S4CHLAM37_04540 [Chlamydiia bacterium]|nr:hypothetical protein [Chlamydiia bacterium]
MEPTIHYMDCVDPWFSKLNSSEKVVEGRKGSDKNRKIKPSDLIIFREPTSKQEFTALVVKVDTFSSIRDYLEAVTVQEALPGIATIKEAENIYLQWSTYEEVQSCGFLAIWIKKSKQID